MNGRNPKGQILDCTRLKPGFLCDYEPMATLLLSCHLKHALKVGLVRKLPDALHEVPVRLHVSGHDSPHHRNNVQ